MDFFAKTDWRNFDWGLGFIVVMATIFLVFYVIPWIHENFILFPWRYKPDKYISPKKARKRKLFYKK